MNDDRTTDENDNETKMREDDGNENMDEVRTRASVATMRTTDDKQGNKKSVLITNNNAAL